MRTGVMGVVGALRLDVGVQGTPSKDDFLEG